jgi:nucleoside-diphosphate-sugar epimerase
MTTETVAVTGAGGYVGRHVVTALLDRGHAVLAVVRPGSTAILDPRATIVESDVLNADLDTRIAAADGVVHLAWKDGFSHNSPAHMLQLSGHYGFLTEIARSGVSRLVALGTMHEVGYWEGAIDASTPTNPLSQYGIAKDALRRSLELALPTSIGMAWARCYYIYGDDRRNNSIFARLLEAADEGRTEFPFVTGRAKHDFIKVDELGRQIAALYDARDVTGIVNCATGEPMSIAEKVEEFIAENELDISLQYGAFPDRPYDSPAVWGDATLIHGILARES